MLSITKTDQTWAIQNMGIEIKLFKGEFTRETATQIAIATLVKRDQAITINKIDDLCFLSWGFPISHRKGKPSKNIGGLSVKKRIDRYTYNNKFMSYDLNNDTFTIADKILSKVKANIKFKVRKKFIFKTLEKVRTRDMKNIALSKFKKSISNMLYMHLLTAGKLSY